MYQEDIDDNTNSVTGGSKTAVNSEELLQWFEETMQTINTNQVVEKCTNISHSPQQIVEVADKSTAILSKPSSEFYKNQVQFIPVDITSCTTVPQTDVMVMDNDISKQHEKASNPVILEKPLNKRQPDQEPLLETGDGSLAIVETDDFKENPTRNMNERTSKETITDLQQNLDDSRSKEQPFGNETSLETDIEMKPLTSEENQDSDTRQSNEEINKDNNLKKAHSGSETNSETDVEMVPITNHENPKTESWEDTFVPALHAAVSSSKGKAEKRDDSRLSKESEDDSADSSSDDSDTSDSDDSSASKSDDEDSDSLVEEKPRMKGEVSEHLKSKTPKTAKSVLLGYESSANKLNVSVPTNVTLEQIGKISNFIEDNVVTVKALPMKPALNLGSILFLADKTVFGKISDTFGPVSSPFYLVCFDEDKKLQNLQLNQEIFYAPNVDSLSSYVFTAQLRKLKGSDASWFNDAEPPDNMLDYSDDEQEREAKRKLKQNKLQRKMENSGTNFETLNTDQSSNKSLPARRGRGRAVWSNRSVRYVNPGKQEEDVMQSAWVNALSSRRNAGNCVKAQQMPSPHPGFPATNCPNAHSAILMKQDPNMQAAWRHTFSGIPASAANATNGAPVHRQLAPHFPPRNYNPLASPNYSAGSRMPPPPVHGLNQPHVPPVSVMSCPPPPVFNPPIPINLSVPPPSPETFPAASLPFVQMPTYVFTPPPPPPPPPPPESESSDKINLPDMTTLFSNPPTD